MGLGGATLKLFQTLLYALAFCCAAVVLGIYSYFLATQSDHNVNIPAWEKAVEGMSGIGVLYTIFAVVLTCCLGGITFFAFVAIVLDILLCAAFVGLAVLTRDGADSCTGKRVTTPIGTGPPNSYGQNGTYGITFRFACRLNTAAFAVSIIGAFIFLISAFMQLWLGRHHQREKRFGPSPANNYTSGSGNKWFKRRRGAKTTHAAYAKDSEAAGGLAAADHDLRPSHEPGYTGTTGGYHTGPIGTSVNPYGYENRHTAATNY
jgi:hypothetical protein